MVPVSNDFEQGVEMKKVPKDKLLDKGEVASYTVYYPSGKTLAIEGVFSYVASPNPKIGGGPAIRTEKDELAILDPRALITRAGGIIYSPRTNENLAKPMQEWLSEHPERPPNIN
jgi:hypothetical protein